MHWLRDAHDDLWFGVRRWRRDVTIAVAGVLVLSCGIGLSVAIFTVASTVLKRPFPFRDQQRVVALWGEAGGSMRTLPLTLQHFERYRHEAGALQEVAGTVGIDSWTQSVRDGNQTFRLNISPVTGNFFGVLGSEAVLGRTLQPSDDRRGAAPVAVLSYALWRGRYASAPTVLGRRLQLRNSIVVTIVGVAAPGLEYPLGTEMWVPFVATSVLEVTPLGRLSAQATPRDAAAELRASFEREPASEWRGLRAAAIPLPSLIVGEVRTPLLVLSVAAAVLLLTACFNVSNLLLLRAVSRSQEIAVRRALGASRGRIFRLLVVEGVPLALAAGLFGSLVATELVRLLIALAPANIPRLEEVRLQGVPLALAVLVSCAAALGSGVLPAMWSAMRNGALLRGTGRSTTASRRVGITQRTLVVLQMGLAVFVVFVAGLLLRTLQSLQAIDTGLAADRIAVVELSWPDRKFGNGQQVAALYDTLLPRIQALPGVASVATVNVVPFTGATGGWDGPFVAEGTSSPAAVFNLAVTGPDYFETMGITLRSGRPFDDRDRQGSVAVAVVSERAARLLGVESRAVGRRIRLAGSHEQWRTIVGVVPETRYRAIREAAPTVYIPVAQFAEVLPLITTLAVRTTGPPSAVVPSIRDAISKTDPDVSVLHAAALDDLVTEQFTGPRLNALLVAILGAGAVLLAVVGLYSLLAASVTMRRRELAIRQAVGATPARLRRMVVGQGLWMCAVGLLAGLAAGLGAGRLLSSVLYGVTYADFRTVAGVVGLLTFAALAAGYFPARQATRYELAALLRAE